MDTFGAVHPALEDFINGGVEVFDPAADLGREGTGQDRRQSECRTRGGRDHGQKGLAVQIHLDRGLLRLGEWRTIQ